MPLTRRATLSLSLGLLAAPAMIRPARATCTPADVGKGIVFRRKDGSKGLARREGDGNVVIDYVTNRGDWLDRRRVSHGVFEIGRILQESEFPVVGSSAPDFRWTFSPKPIWPEDGAIWSGKVKEVVEVTISDEKGTLQRERRNWTATFRCFEPRDVERSGCSYMALTVEAEFTGKTGSRSQRWVYFTQLGLGIETRRDGVSNGLTAMAPV